MRPVHELGESGLTLTEVTIVTILAAIVMLGLVGFYLSSQGTWVSASAQAITQREATALLENIGKQTHRAGKAEVGTGTSLELFSETGVPLYAFWWQDSAIHEGPDLSTDLGATITSVAESFQCSRNDSLVTVSMRLRSAQGDRIETSTQFELVNRP